MSSYQYNGLGDRLSQTVNSVTTNYTLDLNTGLAQVLDDGTNTYTYGLGRISQSSIVNQQSQIGYFLGDALGSVRQLTSPTGQITLAQSYDPYGTVSFTAGASPTAYGFTGEQYSAETQMLYLRARWYDPADGRFQSRDTWSGNKSKPLSMNQWLYGYANPIRYIDPTGMYSVDDLPVVLLDPRKLGFYAGENVDLLPYLFYLNPNDFSFTSSVKYNASSQIGEAAISLLAKNLSDAIGQGRIPNLPGDENYLTKFVVKSLGGNTFWERLIEVNGDTSNLFSAWFVTEEINGRTMIAETFPLKSWFYNNYSSVTVYFGSVTESNDNQLILQSDYIKTNIGFTGNLGDLTDICTLSDIVLRLDIESPIIGSDNIFQVKFATKQIGLKSVQTVGEVRLFTDPKPIGVFTMNGTYIGDEWKLHVLDNEMAIH